MESLLFFIFLIATIIPGIQMDECMCAGAVPLSHILLPVRICVVANRL